MDEPKNDQRADTETAKAEDKAAPVDLAEPTKVEEAEVIDPVADSSPDPDPVAKPSPKSGAGAMSLILGGAVVAGLGYLAGTFAPIVPQSTPGASAETAALQSEVTKLSQQIAAIESKLKPVDLTPIETRLTALESTPPAGPTQAPDLTSLETAIAAVNDRLSALEQAPSAVGGALPADAEAVIAVLRTELDAMKSANAAATEEIKATVAETEAKLADAQAEAEKLKAEAEKTAALALRRSAVGRIAAALESGAPYAAALKDLDGMELPAILTENAETGLPSTLDLGAAFPDAARAALEASLAATVGGSWQDRVTAFLKSTTGARSLTPREGDDPDAVLSRAEDAVRRDDLEKAMQDIATLPEAGQAAFAEWIALAKKRQEATAAVAQLTAEVNG